MDKRPQTVFFPDLAALRRGLVPLMFAISLAAGTARAEPLYASATVPLTDTPGAQATRLAQVAVAAELDRIETRDGYHRVALKAWARAGAEQVLFSLPGKRILAGQIPKQNIGLAEPLESLRDPETGITWNRVSIEGWIPQSAAEPRLDPIWAAAWELFAERCTACHQRRVPEHYTANQWRSLIKVMGPRTGLPKEEQMLILAFLQNHASDTIDQQPKAGARADTDARR
ncbi:trimethylamine-N-oxide reductase (cytochrome c), cytochrome c-type subunit TorC [Aliiruegeria lutimaris]|uniref:Trimethylamine-N-oxide reductase (Cytochrome c), cytochrome c-type subunit TorC n=1 Tax=Aliiruegeria lutimaris TaxID=571298 RepID=A0A1G8T8Q6_9RHOB|nr:trimethylamine-N-oxide reductase (cytochrome c), cytochrome c-type subunit TorC [Aliiruegeria lutimaris]